VTGEPITASADLGRELPADPAERLDRVAAAVASLRSERRRLTRLGLEVPIARCEAHLRYWEFLAGLLALEPTRSLR